MLIWKRYCMFAVAYFACSAVGQVFHCLHVLHMHVFAQVVLCVYVVLWHILVFCCAHRSCVDLLIHCRREGICIFKCVSQESREL